MKTRTLKIEWEPGADYGHGQINMDAWYLGVKEFSIHGDRGSDIWYYDTYNDDNFHGDLEEVQLFAEQDFFANNPTLHEDSCLYLQGLIKESVDRHDPKALKEYAHMLAKCASEWIKKKGK